ncbi:MAG: KdsC family phosphatase [Prochlorococcaceae cyanobacterium]|uniref:KdsC family phosphatase n=1 Tax=Cyanobium sp. ATX 6A2 TaxID=2823700 RepID=UPI0020CF137C|nr:HAD family hydrolase [Cyanobium sp. ATX 6A2]
MTGLGLRSRLQRLLLGRRLAAVRLLVCDVDGVLTDGGLHYDESGRVVKRFDVRDGLAVRMLQRSGIEVALLSGGRSGAIEQRARHLGIEHCRVGVGDKAAGLEQLQAELAVAPAHTAFIGDDLNDLTVRPRVALLISPADGANGLRQRAHWVLRRRGGNGALRELAEALLQQRGALKALQRHGWREGNG